MTAPTLSPRPRSTSLLNAYGMETPGKERVSDDKGVRPLAAELDKAAITSWCQEQYKKCKDNRSQVENQWYMNMAFYFGKQNVRQTKTPTSSTGYALTIPPAPPWRVRLIVNKIRPMIRTMLAKTVAQKPIFTVVPATTEDEDLSAARVAEKIFEAAYSKHNIKRIIRRAEWWTLICGSAFMKCYWDEGTVDKVSNQQGDIVIEHITPFHVLVPDLREEDLEKQPYMIHMTMKSQDWVRHTYGNEIAATPTRSHDDILQAGFLNLVGVTHKNDEVLVLEFWIKPGNRHFPKGGLVTMIGDTVVQAVDTYPYDHGEFPFMKLDHIPSGKFYGTSTIEDLIGIQREYNRTRSQIIEAKNTMGKPKLLYQIGSIDPNRITSEPGQGIGYKPGFQPPTPMPMAPLPAHVMQEVQQLQEDMDDISGQHDISRGKNPSQVTAATALSFLQEQDDTKLSDTISSLEEATEKLGRHILSFVTQFWTTERTVQVVGKDGSFDAQRFKGSAIGGNHDVRVEAGSALPQSKAAKQAFLMDLMKLGIIPPEKGLEMMDLGGIEKVYEDYLVDVRQAQRENLKLSQGLQLFAPPAPPQPMLPGMPGSDPILPSPGLFPQPDPLAQPEEPLTGYEPNEWDSHEVHINIHNKFRKSQEFEMLDEETKEHFKQHVELHQMAIGQGPLGMPVEPQIDPATGQQVGGPPVGSAGQVPPDQTQLQQQPTQF